MRDKALPAAISIRRFSCVNSLLKKAYPPGALHELDRFNLPTSRGRALA
jgi:hypothetical protein